MGDANGFNYDNLDSVDIARTLAHIMRHESAAPSAAIQSEDTLCRFFLRGICRYGDRCRFRHDPSASTTYSTTTTNTTSSRAAARTKGDNNSNCDLSSWVNAPIFIPKSPNNNSTITTINNSFQSVEPDDDDDDDEDANPQHKPSHNEEHDNNSNINMSYAQVLGDPKSSDDQQIVVTGDDDDIEELPMGQPASILCPYLKNGETLQCRYGNLCIYDHGDLCDMCGRYCLHPTDEDSRKRHRMECVRQHELDMEMSFGIARSKDKKCGVCFEVIIEKTGGKQRFGILPNCNHVFCLQCIRKWRQSKQFENKIIRACPECRVTSDFVCPSDFWVETKEDKKVLIEGYKQALKDKDCKYFEKGRGTCPFANKCFYKHTLASGEAVDVGGPRRSTRRPNYFSESHLMQQVIFWDLLGPIA